MSEKRDLAAAIKTLKLLANEKERAGIPVAATIARNAAEAIEKAEAELSRLKNGRQEQIIRTLEAEVLRLQRLNQLAESARGEAEDRLKETCKHFDFVRQKYHLSPDVGFEDLAKIRAELQERVKWLKVRLEKADKVVEAAREASYCLNGCERCRQILINALAAYDGEDGSREND